MQQPFKAFPAFCLLVLVSLPGCAVPVKTVENPTQELSVFELREQDWRNGALVYQVLVDRFAPVADLQSKSHFYQPPKKIRDWSETPKSGVYLEDAGVWSHEIEFWGGDLSSLRSQLSYLDELGIDVLYLNPIHSGFTNHKYDSLDFETVSPEFGSREDVSLLADDVHQLGMKLVLDGVFNHMGRNSDKFQQALNNPESEYRDWFYFGDQYPGGTRVWAQAKNLPELNLENEAVRQYIYADKDSIVQQYLRQGTDGWRLDVAYDIGYRFLNELTMAAHQAKPGSLVVGEIWNYPAGWFPSLDGVMNFTAREIIWRLCLGKLEPKVSGEMLDRMISDAGIEPMLKSWMVLDNHDTPRLKNMLPETWQQNMAQVLQFTLPGSPNLYYGTELGMTGGGDPEMRAPMRWDLVNDSNETLTWTRKLISMRKQHRALRVGDFSLVTSTNLLAFERYTDRVEDTVFVIINPTNHEISESVLTANSSLMNWTTMTDLLNTHEETIFVNSAMLHLKVAARSFMVLKPDVQAKGGYTPYKRVP
jgi:glycosidase